MPGHDTPGKGKRDGMTPSITHPRRYLDHVLGKRGIELPDVPPRCVITYCRDLIERATARHEHQTFDIGVTVATRIHVLSTASGGRFGLVAGRPGAPMAAVLLEELIELGFHEFMVFGPAGQPTNGLGSAGFGQVVLPDRAYVYEGTSAHYGLRSGSVPVSTGTREVLARNLREAGIEYVEGPAATTDALYRETPELIAELLELGVRVIDMELSALLSVAWFRGAELAAVLCVSDVIHQDGTWDVGLTSDDLRRTEDRLLPVLERAGG